MPGLKSVILVDLDVVSLNSGFRVWQVDAQNSVLVGCCHRGGVEALGSNQVCRVLGKPFSRQHKQHKVARQ